MAEKKKTWNDFYHEVKAKKPELPANLARELASDLYNEWKKAQEAVSGSPGDSATSKASGFNRGKSQAIETFIRADVVDMNRIKSGFFQNGVPLGSDNIIIDGPAGDGNTYVHVEVEGLRVPVDGSFKIFL